MYRISIQLTEYTIQQQLHRMIQQYLFVKLIKYGYDVRKCTGYQFLRYYYLFVNTDKLQLKEKC